MTELKPCPVCGSANVGVRSWWNALHETGYFAECMDCGCMVGFMADPMGWCAAAYDTEEEAAEAWNTRAERTCRDKGGIGTKFPAVFICSECGWCSTVFAFGECMPRYCPNCGAKVVER